MDHAHVRATAGSGIGGTSLNHRTPPTHHDQLVKQTQKWVAQTFYGALLKQMRDSPFKVPMFDGGRGGEAFQSLYDQRLADHMARGTGHKLVNAIVSKIEAGKAYGRSARSRNQLKKPAKLPLARPSGRAHVPPALRA